jgi:hypothetical protein
VDDAGPSLRALLRQATLTDTASATRLAERPCCSRYRYTRGWENTGPDIEGVGRDEGGAFLTRRVVAGWTSVGMAEGKEGRLTAAKEENARLRESLSEKDREIFLLKVRRGAISFCRNRRWHTKKRAHL